MSIIKNVGNGQWADMTLTPEEFAKEKPSSYAPTPEEREVRAMILRHFSFGYQNMYKPRREFND